MPDIVLQVAQGADLYRPFQAVDYNGTPIVGTFLSSDALSCVLWPAGGSPASKLAVAPIPAWLSANLGTFSLELHSLDSLTIAPGLYEGSVEATRGTDSAELLAFILEVTAYGAVLGPVPVSTVPTQVTSQRLATLYCTDEDIAVKIGGEFIAISHDDQLLAAGTDGIFAPADPWTLVSASNDFGVQGITAGSVVLLRRPSASFTGGGHLLGVSAVTGSGLTLRRRGMPPGGGQAPAPSTGLTGVDFWIRTFAPQIEEETYTLNQKYNIDPAFGGRMPGNLYDLRPLRRACVLRVLLNRYTGLSAAGMGDYKVKADQARFELGEVEAKLQLRWGTTPGTPCYTNLFNTRIER